VWRFKKASAVFHRKRAGDFRHGAKEESLQLTLSPAAVGPIGHTLILMINALKKLKVRHR
jgi:hypothetical protein